MDEVSFRFRYPVDVRFKDIDIGGHAHHSHALVYFEEARAAFWREVVAEARVRYHSRVLWPQRLDVGVRVSRLGKRHFVMEYEVLSGDGERLISGESTQVMYDYETAATKPIPEAVAGAIAAWDGPFGPGGVPRSEG